MKLNSSLTVAKSVPLLGANKRKENSCDVYKELEGGIMDGSTFKGW